MAGYGSTSKTEEKRKMIEFIIIMTFSGTSFMLGVMNGHKRARPSEHKLAQIRKIVQEGETKARLGHVDTANRYMRIRDIITK